MTAASKPALPSFFDPSLFSFPGLTGLPGLSFGKADGATVPALPQTPLDFPLYFISLVQTTFDAIVNTTIAQMEAYSELLMQATISAGSFTQAFGTAADLPAIQKAAALVEAEPTPAGVAKGINRIVVTDGSVKAKTTRARKPRTSTAGKTVRSKAAPKAAAKA